MVLMYPFPEAPTIVQLTERAVVRFRVPEGDAWMVFDVDSVAPSTAYPGEWICHIRDYRYGKDPAGMLGRNYQVWTLEPGDYEPI